MINKTNKTREGEKYDLSYGFKKRDIIKLISPSNGIKKAKINELEQACEVIKNHNYKVLEDKYVRCSKKGMSASSLLRSEELNNSFRDDSKALIAVSGGDFINQIMDKVKFKYFLNNIKWIQGHSDLTILLYYITTNYDIATIYNFNVKKYISQDKTMINKAFMALENTSSFKQESFTSWDVITNFKEFHGRIIGGCLEL